MKVKQHIWWILAGIFLLFCVGFVIAAYRFGWSSTGFVNKSLWDWLQLLIVPLMLAIVALVFQLTNSSTERQIAKLRYEQDQSIALNKQREDLLQIYLDHMSELLLEKSLRISPSEEVRNVARVRTITILFQLDAKRIGHVITFLRESGLMSTKTDASIVSLKGADFSEANFKEAVLDDANLSGANLIGADLRFAFLERANLSNAVLSEADLWCADLRKARLEGADLSRADLSGADLSGANLSRTNIEGAQSLKDTDLHGAKGLTKEQLEACKAKGAIIDDDITISPPQSSVSPSPLLQSNDAQIPGGSPTQVNTPILDTGGSSTTSP